MNLVDKIHDKYVKAFNVHKKSFNIVGPITDVSYYYVDFDIACSFISDSYLNPEILIDVCDYMPTRNITGIIKMDGKYFKGKHTDISFSLFTHENENGKKETRMTLDIDFNEFTILGDNVEDFGATIVQYILQNLASKETLIAKKEIKTIRAGREKIIPICFISSKKYTSDYDRKLGEPLDWKHSWQVIGHWRNISGIGKDRDGYYNQTGRTWVIPCVKGEGELIKKVRAIK